MRHRRAAVSTNAALEAQLVRATNRRIVYIHGRDVSVAAVAAVSGAVL
jgi:hypothetical protein